MATLFGLQSARWELRKWAIRRVVKSARLRQDNEWSSQRTRSMPLTSWHQVCQICRYTDDSENTRLIAPRCSEKNIWCHDIFMIRCVDMHFVHNGSVGRLRATTTTTYLWRIWDTSGGHLAQKGAGLGVNFWGSIVITVHTEYNGYFSRDF